MARPGAEPEIVAGRYRLGKRLGGGGFGDVYEAEHMVTEQRLAIKLLHRRDGVEQSDDDRFLREPRLAARVESDHVAAVLDAGIEDGIHFIAMERLVGEDLGRRLARNERFSPAETALFLAHAAEGLAVAHGMAIVHRDLKPSNLFLTSRPDGRPLVKVLDFGTAKALEGSAGDMTTMAAGTPLYMAPEQFGSRPASAEADIYALGICAFQMLTGVHYFELERAESTNPFALASILAKGPPESARARAARYDQELPRVFDAWFARCCHASPEARFPAVVEAAAALAEALGVEGEALAAVQAHTPRSPEIPKPPAQTETLEPQADRPSTQGGHSVSRRRARRSLGPLAALAVLSAFALWALPSERASRVDPVLAGAIDGSTLSEGVVPSSAPAVTGQPLDAPPASSASTSADPIRAIVQPRPPPVDPPSRPAPKPSADEGAAIDELWSRD
jgi:eukaryotic-like serine/threonine-protein kinase